MSMAGSLSRQGRNLLNAIKTRSMSSDALVEFHPGEIGIVSGIPQQHLNRRDLELTWQNEGHMMVYVPLRSFVFPWWENPLMGWTSTGDPYANVGEAGLTFDSEQTAKAFAQRHGWQYAVKKRHVPVLKPKAYADNFKWKGPPKQEN